MTESVDCQNEDALPEDRGASPDTPAIEGGMTDKQLAESKEYGRRSLFCALLDMAIDAVYLIVVAFFVAVLLDRWLLSWPLMANRWLRLAALFLITMAAHYAISFPLSLYSGFLLEHQYKLSRQSFWRWLRRYVLQSLLITGFGLAMIVGLFAIIWWTGPWWWWIATLATLVVTVVLGQLVPVLILPLFYKIERLEDADLAARFSRLAEGTSLNVEGVYRMAMSTETVKANAMLAGLGRTRRVILGDTLLDQFTPEEIEVVFAHEMGHHVFHHIRKLMLLGIVSTAASFFVCDRVVVAWVGAQSGTLDYSQMPVYAAPMILMIVTLFSLIFSPLRNALSRRFETDCDRYALHRTGNCDAYRSAFSKLARLNKSDPDPHPLEVVFLHDHPPVAARLAMAQQASPTAR